MGNNGFIRRQIAISSKVSGFLEKTLLRDKLDNWPGYVFAGILAVVYGYLMATQLILGLGLIGLAIGVLIVAICLISPERGLYITIIYSLVVCDFSRMFFAGNLQAGIFLDALIVATLAGLLGVRVKKAENAYLFDQPLIKWILIYFVYVSLQLFNPAAHSLAGWYAGFRKIMEELLLLFITFHVLNSYRAIRRFIKVLFITAVLVGFYGCIQQWFGLTEYNQAWVLADQTRFGLFFIGNAYRKFSSMSDPTDFGMVMAAVASFYIIIAIHQKPKLRWRMLAGVLLIVLGMSYSGTRTSNIMVVGGIGVFVLLSINKRRTQIFALSAAFILTMLIRLPIYSNATLNRFRSSFSGKEDPSFNVRELSRKSIQPYIYTHPIGGGLGTTNNFGKLMNPGHELAGFQTDNGYLRICLEQGWIGLLLICIIVFLTMNAGVKGYFQSQNERTKYIYPAALACLFGFYLAQLAQEVTGQVAIDVILFPMTALLLRLNWMQKQGSDTEPVLYL